MRWGLPGVNHQSSVEWNRGMDSLSLDGAHAQAFPGGLPLISSRLLRRERGGLLRGVRRHRGMRRLPWLWWRHQV